MRSTCAIVAAAWALASGGPGQAVTGAGVWGAPTRLSPPRELSIYPDVGVDDKGDAMAVWEVRTPAGRHEIVTRRRNADADRWTKGSVLASARDFAGNPQIAVNAAGMAVATWQSGGSGPSQPVRPPAIQASTYLRKARRWSKPFTVSGKERAAFGPRAGIDTRGDMVVSWFAALGKRDAVEVASRGARSTVWSPPRRLAVGQLLDPELAVSTRGDAVLVWKVWRRGSPFSTSGTTSKVVGVAKAPGKSWQRPVTLGTEVEPPGQGPASFYFPRPRVAIDARGDAAAVWQGKRRGRIVVLAATRSPRHGWTQPGAVAGTPALEPCVAMDQRGDLTTIWVGPKAAILEASKPLTGRQWSAPMRLGVAGPFFDVDPELSEDSRGDAVATWNGDPTAAALRLGSTTRWQPAVGLGMGGVSSSAINTRGAIVVWQRPLRRSVVIEAATYS